MSARHFESSRFRVQPRRPWRFPLCLAVALALLTLAPPAEAYFGVLPGLGFFQPPNAAGSDVESFSGLGGAGVPWSGYSFWVDERGLYTIASSFVSEEFDGRVLLYRGPMDAEDPLDRLITVADYDESSSTEFEVLLEAGVIYYLTTTFATDTADGTVDFDTGVAAGPGRVRPSACFPPGDVGVLDAGEALELGEDWCVEVDWRDHQNRVGRGTTVPYRSFDSGMFWFFRPDNWELLVKVLDGCAINGHYWVFYAATTDVEFDLWVGYEFAGSDAARVYRNELGQRADAVTDTAAFPCDDL